MSRPSLGQQAYLPSSSVVVQNSYKRFCLQTRSDDTVCFKHASPFKLISKIGINQKIKNKVSFSWYDRSLFDATFFQQHYKHFKMPNELLLDHYCDSFVYFLTCARTTLLFPLGDAVFESDGAVGKCLMCLLSVRRHLLV